MYVTLRKALLVSTMGVCGLVSAPVGFSLVATGPAHPFAMSALASGDDDNSGRGGSDDRGGDDRSSEDRSHDDRDDHGGNSGRGSDHDDNDNDNDDDNDHRGRHGHDNANDDDADDDRNDRDEVTLSVSEDSLRGLRDGSLVAVDNLGRALEVEVEFEHGQRVVTVKPHGGDARRNPGPITSVSIVPASAR